MKISRSHPFPALMHWGGALLFLCLFVGFVSWIVGIYIDEVCGLFTPAGIRWMVVNAMPNFADAPLAKIIVAIIAIGSLKECGLIGRVRMKSLKQRRAFQITCIAAVLFVAALVVLTFGPGHTLLSVYGTVEGSSLQNGWYGIVCLFVLIISNVYGYTSGRFVNRTSIIEAHTTLLSQTAPYFITLFLSSQLVAILGYSNLLALIGSEHVILAVVRAALYYIPLLFYLLR